jgi:hypothetical protein
MENSGKNYPTFDFTVEGFEKLRTFGNEIDNIEEKVDFYNYQIQRYDEQHSLEPYLDSYERNIAYLQPMQDWLSGYAYQIMTHHLNIFFFPNKVILAYYSLIPSA